MTRLDEWNELLTEARQYPPELDTTEERCQKRIHARRRRSLWWKTPAVAFITAVFVFTVLCNTSVPFARAVGEMPVLSDLADAAAFDPGLKAVVEDKYAQPVGLSQTVNGITLFISYIIADRQQLVLFYSVSGKGLKTDSSNVSVNIDSLTGQNGEKPKFSYSSDYSGSQPNLQSCSVLLPEANLSDIVHLTLSLSKDTVLNPDADVLSAQLHSEKLAVFSFTLEPQIMQNAEIYTLNRNITFNNQKVTVNKVEISPTVTKIDLSCDPKNTAFLNNIDLSLTDERGRNWDMHSGISSLMDKTGRNIGKAFISSSYFSNARHLYLNINQLGFLPKDELKVKVDVKNATASPLPKNIRLVSLKRQGDRLIFTFSQTGQHTSANLFNGNYTDSSGQPYCFSTSTFSYSTQSFAIDHFAGDVVWLERGMAPCEPLPQPIRIQLK